MVKQLKTFLPGLCVFSLLFIFTGCEAPNPADKYKDQLATMQIPDLTIARIVDETPIIDIHTHNFNGRDIPLRGIVLGRRDARPPYTWFIGDDLAKFIAAVIVAETHMETPKNRAAQMKQTHVERVAEITKEWGVDRTSAGSITNQDHYQAIQKLLKLRNDHESLPLTFGQKMALRSLAAMFGHTGRNVRKSVGQLLDDFSPFIADMTSSDEELLSRYFDENGTNIHFRIAHMMDMGPTYDEWNGHGAQRRFEDEIDHMKQLQQDPHAHLAYFVAYSPFRDNKYPGQSLGIVQDALANKNAYGVKIYPPAGYRATSNDIPSRPWAITKYPGLQWDARYTRNGKKISNGELDDRLLELLRWCATNHIPVFAHSGYGEFQARSGYGSDMPNPLWWGYVLTNHPELKELRLCLAHAGGGDEFFGDTTFKSWNRVAYELCTQFPNVYCEVGCLDQILDPDKQAHFAMNMQKLFMRPPDEKHPYAFSSKIMYGSDWYMPISGGSHKAFLAAYQKVFLLPQLQPYYRAFFLDNALNYLNAADRLKDKSFPLDPVVASQLKVLLAKRSP